MFAEGGELWRIIYINNKEFILFICLIVSVLTFVLSVFFYSWAVLNNYKWIDKFFIVLNFIIFLIFARLICYFTG